MYIYLIYIFVFLIGVLTPIRMEKLIKIYIVSLVFDDLRFADISITNLVLIVFIIKTIYLIKQKGLFKISISTIYLVAFAFVVFLASLISKELGGFKSLISLINLLISCICISQLIKVEKYRKSFFDSIILMSGIAALSVIAETILFYVFNIKLRDSEFGLQNLSTYFYFSSGFFSSNGLAVFHIIPGLVLFLFNKNENRKFHFTYKIIIWLGILFAATRGGIVISLVALSLLLFQFLRTTSRLFKYIGYAFLLFMIFVFTQIVIFVSYFNISSLVARFYIINGAVNSIYQHPILGTGLASQVTPISTDIDLIDNALISDNVLNSFDNRETHNTILQIGIEMGLLGIIVFILLMIYLILKLQKTYKAINNYSNDNQDVHSTLYLLFLFFLSINMNSYLYLKLLWIIIGYTAGLNIKYLKYNIK